jgi:hypothetical protein
MRLPFLSEFFFFWHWLKLGFLKNRISQYERIKALYFVTGPEFGTNNLECPEIVESLMREALKK